MKYTIGLVITVFLSPLTMNAQMRVLKIVSSAIVHVPAEQLWKVIGDEYGSIGNISPHIVSSGYIGNITRGSEGCERVCSLNESGTRFIKERMSDFDSQNITFTNIIYQSGRLPLDPEYTRAVYKVERIDSSSSRIVVDFQYRTKPAFLGIFAKGTFKKMVGDTAVYAEHYIKTGEKITKSNYRRIKKAYKKTKSSKAGITKQSINSAS